MEIEIQEIIVSSTEIPEIEHVLKVTATSKVEPQHSYVTAGFGRWFKKAWNALPKGPYGDNDLGIWTEGDRLIGYEDEEHKYKQSTNLSKEEVRKICRSAIVDGDWVLKDQTYKVVKEVVVLVSTPKS